MKLLPSFLLAAPFVFLTAPVQAQHPEEIRRVADTTWEAARQENNPIEFVLPFTAPLGSTKGSITGAAVLQYTPPVGSNKGSLTGHIEGVAECGDTGVCRAEMVLFATRYQHNQTDPEFLATGEFDLTTREWLSLNLILPYLEQDN
jgi:hypothetical protein